VGLSHGASRVEVWRAPGAESEASNDLLSACETASKILFRTEHTLASEGSLKPKLPDHALVGGLLGPLLYDVLDGLVLLPASPTLQPLPLTLHAFGRGAVLHHPRAGAMLLLFDAGLSPRRVDIYEHDATSRTLSGGNTANDAMLDAFVGKKSSDGKKSSASASTRAASEAEELVREDGLPVDGALVLRLWYTLEQLQSVLGSMAGALAAGGAFSSSSELITGSGRDTLVDLTLAVTKPSSRRLVRRQVLPEWRGQWAKRGTECPPDAPVPPAITSLPTETFTGTWPTTALKRAVGPPPPPLASVSPSTGAATTARRHVRVLLLTGPPGAAMAEAAAGVYAVSSGSARWLPPPDVAAWCDGTGGVNSDALSTLLAQSVAGAPPAAPPSSLPEALVLTTRGMVDLPSAVGAVVAACEGASAMADARLALHAVVTCIDAPRALEAWAIDGDARCAPGVVETLDDGFVQSVLVCRTSELPAAAEGALTKLVGAAAPTAERIRVPRSARAAGSDIGALVARTEAPFAAPAMCAARLASSVEWGTYVDGTLAGYAPKPPPPPPPNPALGGVYVLTLPPPPPLSIAKLEEKVAQLLALPPAIMSSAGKPPPPQLLLINGVVYSAPPLVASDMSAHETDAVDVSEGAPPTHVRTFLDLSSGAMRAPYGAATHEGASAAERAESLTCLVRDLSPHDLATALLACRPLPPRRTPFTKGTLPEEKLEVLRSELFEHGTLPDDVFFD